MKKLLLFILFLSLIYSFIGAEKVKSATDDNVFGWAWSENIGWISFNNTTGGGGIGYGVNIDSETGIFSGYAWSENIGWISFNQADLLNCPQLPCRADLNSETGNVSGWAKILSDNEGWIRLRNGDYGVSIDFETGDFSNWAWSDNIGWISFAGIDYKVQTSFAFNFAPIASFACDNSSCSGGECNTTNWITYRPIADPIPCIYTIKNNSTDPDGLSDIVKSEWFIKKQIEPDSAYVLKTSCVMCDYTPQDMSADNYSIKLRVEDSKGLSSLVTHSFVMREEVSAGFMCSLDNTTWRNCSFFAVSENEIVYFKDDQLLAEHSNPSTGAASISTRTWTKNGVQFSSGVNPSTTITKTEKTIRLIVVDSNNRTDYIEYILSVKMNLPDWQEIAPF
ncbi:hypothetical protein KKA72_02370 [Patescibacteria group bacterium]|nr:hypothetical protein [Patescibacteria group bacterium]MBU1877164.1 hypothetical protein [Patescibacteria group bacterium]